jgi:diketogulonate reductase-like aldo/keto reductase
MSGRKEIDMNNHLLNRRQFGARCAALGLSVPAASAMMAVQARAQNLGTDAETNRAPRTVKFPDGTIVPALGQGSWHLAERRHSLAVEEEAMRTGIALGMTLIDTSRNYADGRTEKLIGRVIAGQRDKVFLVSKIQEDEIVAGWFDRGIEGSLNRLGTDYLDLYLLHSPVPKRYLSGVVAKFEKLRADGKIRAWGVSNFNVEQMEELFGVPDGHRCATNQVRYSLHNKYFDRDVLPWCAEHKMPVMAASPLGGLEYARTLLGEPTLAQIGAQHGVSAAAAALGWVMRSGNVIAIPESGTPAHVKENAVAQSIRWIPADA